MATKEPESWITVNGRHIPIGAGESKEDAISKALSKDANTKEKQISNNEQEAKRLNEATKVDDGKSGNQNEQQFNKSITDAKASRPVVDRWRVDVHTAQEYKEEGCKCWKSPGGSTIAVTNKGDIISVCKHSNDKTMSGSDILQRAVKMGGTKLDSFAGNHVFYTKNGFEPVSWTRFNEKYAPEGWKESGCGKEPVIFYRYVGKGNVKYYGQEGLREFIAKVKAHEGEDGYDNAYAERDKAIK